MRRGELLIKQVQRATENERTGTQDGISLEEYYQYLTDGVRGFQREILKVNAQAYRAEAFYDATGSESYDLPIDLLVKNRVAVLEYSPTGLAKDYYRLEKSSAVERFSYQGHPSRYFLMGAKFYVNCIPSQGRFRMVYDRALPAVDKRRATVSSHTVTTTQLTALTLAGYTATDYDLYDHLSVVSFDGTVKLRGVPYTAVNAGTGIVSIQGGAYTFPEGSTIANGDYVTLGAYASTHPQIDDDAEGFLLAYTSRRILMRDSSSDAAELTTEEKDMLAGIVALYAESPDIEMIPITNFDLFQDLS